MGSWRCQLHFFITSSYLEASWAQLHLWPFGVHLGLILGPPWATLGPLGRIFGHLGLILGPLESIFGPSWGHLGHLGAILVVLGAILVDLGAILGLSWAVVGSYSNLRLTILLLPFLICPLLRLLL